MRWTIRALFFLAIVLLAPWLPFHNSTLALPRSIAVIVFGIAWALWMVTIWRTKAYRTWSATVRWPFLLLLSSLVTFGAVGLAYVWAQNMGWPATIWFITAPFIYGLLNYVLPSAPPAAQPD